MRRLALALALVAAAIAPAPARAAEAAVLSAGAMRSLLQELAAPFAAASGHRIAITFATAGEVERRLAERESFDVGIATKPRIQTLEGAGTILGGSVAVIGRSPIALAVRQGAAKPDIASLAAFREALLAAPSIAYTDPASGGTSGIHMEGVMRRLGIAEQVAGKTRRVTGRPGAPPAVGEAVAQGEAALGLQPISELIGTPGIDIVGPIPAELQTPDLTYAAGLVTGGRQRQAGKAFIEFLASPDAAAVIRAKGLIPGDGR